MENNCTCENSVCVHGDRSCKDEAVTTLRTIYGRFPMCQHCAANMPAEYLKADAYPDEHQEHTAADCVAGSHDYDDNGTCTVCQEYSFVNDSNVRRF